MEPRFGRRLQGDAHRIGAFGWAGCENQSISDLEYGVLSALGNIVVYQLAALAVERSIDRGEHCCGIQAAAKEVVYALDVRRRAVQDIIVADVDDFDVGLQG